MKIKKSELRLIIKEILQEKNEYRDLVKQVMNMLDIDSPQDLNKSNRAKFFSYLDSLWDKKNGKKVKEPNKKELRKIIKEIAHGKNENQIKQFDHLIKMNGFKKVKKVNSSEYIKNNSNQLQHI